MEFFKIVWTFMEFAAVVVVLLIVNAGITIYFGYNPHCQPETVLQAHDSGMFLSGVALALATPWLLRRAKRRALSGHG